VRRHPLLGEPHLVLDAEGRYADPLEDDQAVVVDTSHGLAVVCGCAHAGPVNTLEAIAALRPGEPVALLVGGLHLGPVAEPVLEQLCVDLGRYRLARCAIGHCTGELAERVFARRLGGGVATLACGTRLEIP